MAIGLLVAVGCTVGGNEEPQISTSYRAISSAKWLSCWVRPGEGTDPFFTFDTIECSATIGEGKLALVGARTEAIYGDTETSSANLTTSEPVIVARIQRDKYPVKINAMLRFQTTDPVLRTAYSNGSSLNVELTIPSRDAYSFEKPIVVEQAYDLWEINIDVQSAVFAAVFDKYDVTLPMGITEAAAPGAPKIEVLSARTPSVPNGQSLTFVLPIAHGERAHLTGSAMLVRSNTAPKVRFEIDGPGSYVATETGIERKAETTMGTAAQALTTCPTTWNNDGVCDRCLSADPDCRANDNAGCEAQWRGDSICDACLGNDSDCGAVPSCPTTWRGDGVCDECLGNDPDCATDACPSYFRNDGVCDACLGDDPDCATMASCPAAWRGDGGCDACLGDDPDCAAAECPTAWRGDGVCDACLGDDPDCASAECPAAWRDDGVCDACLGDDPDCSNLCPMEWSGDGVCDDCLGNDPDCDEPSCPVEWYGDGYCDACLGDDPDCL
jgi:hypothetical protein